MPQPVRRFAGVVARHGGRVALVLEHQSRWERAHWTVPSGEVEPHETPEQGAARELAEETGLVVAHDELRLVSTSETSSTSWVSRAWNFTAEVEDPRLCVDDPDRQVHEARWFTPHEAITLLASLPYAPMAEPILAHLRWGARHGAALGLRALTGTVAAISSR
ncbi:NUDIX hydrolase [Nocardioides sp.]|uniref:NUDIX hydrolase n=1 Tax=Nocardioides sp. TaxID=35761 RepID=UPI00286CEC6A|nr:NUDIX hydrolase [Nocardioides sp.]